MAGARLRDVVGHLRILAADADEQNAWLHPCGWTREEPFAHVEKHPPCMPIGELLNSLADMWPAWRLVLQPVLTSALAGALDELLRAMGAMDEQAWVDQLETLDRPDWGVVRALARQALEAAEPILDAL